jgi:hypothetical protein
MDRTFPSLERAQVELDEWIEDYNLRRPHQSLKMATPGERFYATRMTVPTPVLDLRTFNEDRSGDDWISRTVSINGVISITNQMFSVGKQRSGHLVDVRVLPTLFQVWDGAELIKSILRTNSKEVRKKRAEPHRKRQNQ